MRIANKLIIILIMCYVGYAVQLVDVQDTHPHVNMINYLVKNKMLPRFSDQTFNEGASVTKKWLIYSLTKMKGIKSTSEVSGLFYDLSKKDITTGYIESAYNRNIIQKSGDRFEPNKVLTVMESYEIVRKFFPDVNYGYKNNNDKLTRIKYLEMLKTSREINKKVEKYKKQLEFGQIVNQKIMGDAISEYLDGSPDALDKVDFLISKEGQAETDEDLIDVIIGDDDLRAAEERKSIESLSFVDKRLNEALVFFYEGKYWKVVQYCNSVLERDPSNTNALSRKGSAFYMLQKFVLAKKYWGLALKTDPENETLEKFVEAL